jgi:arsenate reductase (thioredoxin)
VGYKDLTPAERGQLYMRVQRESEHLAAEFAGIFSQETIERFVNESFESMQTANLIDFVPTFVRRFARERLRATAQAEGLVTKDIPEVLYVCVHNAGRSQMAAVLTQHLGGDRVNVRSAGSDPAGSLNPRVVEAMTEPMLSSRWAAATPAPFTPVSATSIGNWTTPRNWTSKACGVCVKTSAAGWSSC